jgi:hypothetical protein
MIEADFAAEVLLREGRPLVGEVAFLPDENDTAAEAFLAQRYRGGCAGEARADDDKGFVFQIST